MASVQGAFPSSDPRHERLAADQRPRSRPLRGPPVPGLKAKYWRLKRTRPARWAAGRVASTRSHSDSELRRTSVTRTCFRMAVVNRLHSNCRPPIPANAACNFEPSSSPGSKPSTIGVVGQQEIDRRVGGGAIPANQRDSSGRRPGRRIAGYARRSADPIALQPHSLSWPLRGRRSQCETDSWPVWVKEGKKGRLPGGQAAQV